MIPAFIGWSLAARIGAPLLIVAALALLVWGYGKRERLAGRDEGRTEVLARWQAATDKQREVDQAERDRRERGIQEAVDAARTQAEKDRAAAAAAGAAADRLRDAYAAALKRCGNSAATPGSSPADATDSVLADVQRRIDEAAGELAAVADTRYTAGRACERTHDALGKPVP